jgi:putative FmdB family regulatory protein
MAPPLRDIECQDCKHKFEVLLSQKDDIQELKCESCGSIQLQFCFSYPGDYQIKGNNSASTRPRKGR